MLHVGERGSSYISYIFLLSSMLCVSTFIFQLSTHSFLITSKYCFFSILSMYITYIFNSHMHEDLHLRKSKDTVQVCKVLCSFPITIMWWKIMSTTVQLQHDKCECPNWSIGPEWWVVIFFFKPMSLLIYYSGNEQPSSLFPMDIFKAPQIAIWTIL